jgi:hypothetical protein
MGGACTEALQRREMLTKPRYENLEEMGYYVDRELTGRIMLKYMLKVRI